MNRVEDVEADLGDARTARALLLLLFDAHTSTREKVVCFHFVIQM